jgi:hypothetical protein
MIPAPARDIQIDIYLFCRMLPSPFKPMAERRDQAHRLLIRSWCNWGEGITDRLHQGYLLTPPGTLCYNLASLVSSVLFYIIIRR